ncbi:Cell division protein FtsA [Caballeronia sordidicola]|uniref:Cell division protein FtsA n=1 Tax=Caballeronia sordidicola TaxID=196367 RepID=A0A242MCX7_CABSO|nr:Cell division protein FtsA [Caballeronia sordidicola]OTP72256.1 Cell division protein FtsA [Caballeronia sordidicola]
MDVGDGAVGK